MGVAPVLGMLGGALAVGLLMGCLLRDPLAGAPLPAPQPLAAPIPTLVRDEPPATTPPTHFAALELASPTAAPRGVERPAQAADDARLPYPHRRYRTSRPPSSAHPGAMAVQGSAGAGERSASADADGPLRSGDPGSLRRLRPECPCFSVEAWWPDPAMTGQPASHPTLMDEAWRDRPRGAAAERAHRVIGGQIAHARSIGDRVIGSFNAAQGIVARLSHCGRAERVTIPGGVVTWRIAP